MHGGEAYGDDSPGAKAAECALRAGDHVRRWRGGGSGDFREYGVSPRASPRRTQRASSQIWYTSIWDPPCIDLCETFVPFGVSLLATPSTPRRLTANEVSHT